MHMIDIWVGDNPVGMYSNYSDAILVRPKKIPIFRKMAKR